MPIEPFEKAAMLQRYDRLRDLYKRTAGRSVMECAAEMIDIRTLSLLISRDVRRLLNEDYARRKRAGRKGAK